MRAATGGDGRSGVPDDLPDDVPDDTPDDVPGNTPDDVPDGAPDVVPVHVGGRRGAGDRDAEFTAFVREASAELGRVAWYLTGDGARAEDLLATTLLKTYLHWPRAAASEAGPLAYARRVMANARTDAWRRLRRERLVDPAALPDAPQPAAADAHAERDRLARALATLTPRQRRIVALRHLVGLPVAEVAADLGVSEGTVKSVASRGLAQLRAVLDADDAGPPGAPSAPAPARRPGPPGRTP